MTSFRTLQLVVALAAVLSSTSAIARQPSEFLQCDGKPSHMSDAERAARLIAITAVVGLLMPGPEQQDSTERLFGNAGLAACSSALATERDPIRRIELTLARAVHGIEANDTASALADSQSALGLSQAFSSDTYYERSLGLSVLEVRAAALLSAGKYDDAEEAAYRMADAAPWDVINQLNAWPFAGLTDNRNQQFEKFLQRLSKQWGAAQKNYAARLEWNGKFREASAVYAGIMDVVSHAGDINRSNDPSGFWKARQAVALMMAGDRAKADVLASDAHAFNEALATQHSMNASETIGLTDELLEFHKVLSQLADNELNEARETLKRRTRWQAPTTAALSLTIDRLRRAVPPAELVGPLSKSGAEIRQAILDDDHATQSDSKKMATRLFNHMRPPMRASEFKSSSKSVWNVNKSRYLVKKKGPLAGTPYDVINAFDIYGIPSSYAVLMHGALLARSKGKQGFVILGGRKTTDTIAVQFGNSGDPGTPGEMLIDSSAVIHDLQRDFPQPVP